ncbi:MAG: MAPEG family protein [Plesiomonas sp.]
MVSALYAVLGALLLIKFSLDVVKLRFQYKVSFGDGGFYQLQTAIRIHGNAVEYIPIGVLLQIVMEMNGAETWLLHFTGLMLIVGRLLHYFGMHEREFRWRRAGMGATYAALILMIIGNLYYIPWSQIFYLQ